MTEENPYGIGGVLAQTSVGDLLTGWRLVTSLPAIVLVAFAAGRLLGVKRPWTTTALLGVAGWVAGAALSVAIGRHENGAGFTRNLWLFSTFFAMSGTVWLELLAKPGALARAQSGLASISRPIRSIRRRSQRVNRYVQITRIVVRNGFGPSLGLGGESEESEAADRRAPMPVRLRRTLEECGGMFVKLGQVLSTRSDLLPEAVVVELARLQDRVPAADPAEVRALLEEELGGPVDHVFAEFDWEPVAAASIAQAHRARLQSGEPVLVKVQRPGIAAAVQRDMQVLLELARATEARTAWASYYRVLDLAQEFADRLREELDFRGEARNATEIASRLPAGAGVRIPIVHGEELIGLAPLLRRVPRHVDRVATILERGDLRARVSLLADADDVRLLSTWVNRVVLAFLGGVVGVISVGLLAIRGGPPFSGTTSLYQFFGYFGLFCSAVLVLRVLVAILHDGVN